MPVLLCIETSTRSCSVALSKNGKILSLNESFDAQYSHAENLTVYIQKACIEAKIQIKDIDAVGVSKGPGSFTGLRIGVSTAKGLCYSLNKPLIAVNSLEAMASGTIHHPLAKDHPQALFCPMIDAKRMEVYCGIYNDRLKEIKKTSADIIDERSFSELLADKKIFFFGDGAEKCKETITHSNAVFIPNIHPSAQYMVSIAEKYSTERKFEDVAYFEPYYLKDFVGSKPLS